MSVTIPTLAEGTGTVNLSITVSNGTVTTFADPSDLFAGKTVNLALSAATGQDNRINYSAISAIETAFKVKGAAAVSSDTTSGVIPVFHGTDLDEETFTNNNIISELASRATQQNPDVKIINNIKALYNGGNQILQVQSPIALTGTIFCTELEKIQTTANKIHADETLHVLSGYNINVETITLAQLINVYMKCGFNFDGQNTFLPELGGCPVPIYPYPLMALYITDTAKSWDIYRLFERYHAAGKLANLTYLTGQNITVAGNSANGLYDLYNQPLASFPYKVNGQIIGVMRAGFNRFENMYEDGANPIPATISSLTVKNFATKSSLPSTHVYADGACFFQYAPGQVTSTGAVKIGSVGATLVSIRTEYLDLRDLTPNETGRIRNQGKLGEIAFSSLGAAPQIYDDRQLLSYDTGYYVDAGVTKLIPAGSQYYSSNQTSSIYGVLDLQGWANGNPPRNKSEIQSP
jgi:hypothetical protein